LATTWDQNETTLTTSRWMCLHPHAQAGNQAACTAL
jgi:hypothetical protein